MPSVIRAVEPCFDAPAVRVHPLGPHRWTVCRVTAAGRVHMDSSHRLKRDAMRRVRELLADTGNIEAALIDRRGKGQATRYRRAASRVPPHRAP